MNDLYTHKAGEPLTTQDIERLNGTEWLVTNGLGGYASGTLGGTLTRVFHGYLIAALPAPLGRTMMLNDVLESVMLEDGSVLDLNGLEYASTIGGSCGCSVYLTNFRLESGLPVWTFSLPGTTIERRLCIPHHQNTAFLTYRVVDGKPVKLQLRPAVNIRQHEAPVASPLADFGFSVRQHQYEINPPGDKFPKLRLLLLGEDLSAVLDEAKIRDVEYAIERHRGYKHCGDLWSPGLLSARLDVKSEASLVISTEKWDLMRALSPQQAWDSELERKRRLLREAHPATAVTPCSELVWAADQFLFTPVGRQEDTVRAWAAGNEVRSVIAGYHWFTDWGRDTMISLEGLTLTTGRVMEASFILRTFAYYVRDGLIPNMFPEGKTDGLYHTADATLWFFQALKRYLAVSEDNHLLHQLLPVLVDIVGHHLRGTKFNIHVDPSDGLLVQGMEGYQLTWMDAKVENWVVTPRRGKAVEINALWYNALRLLEGWLREADRHDEADGIATHADKCRQSFNHRFWYERGGYLYDLVDGEEKKEDTQCRPNQIFSFALTHPVLDEERWASVLHVVKDRLLTPVGLRSLAPGEPDYKPKYDGDLRSRDAAYHQGTVWGWLIGPFIDAWLRVHPEDYATARGFLSGFQGQLRDACVGTISEIFDAEVPFFPRGCCAQAWSVAEVVRAFVKTSGQPIDYMPSSLEQTQAALVS